MEWTLSQDIGYIAGIRWISGDAWTLGKSLIHADDHEHADDVLFHELVHVFRMMLGISRPKPLSPLESPAGEWDDTEEFIAELLTNIYDSNLGRNLDVRGDAFI
jgi:hypothetical protein